MATFAQSSAELRVLRSQESEGLGSRITCNCSIRSVESAHVGTLVSSEVCLSRVDVELMSPVRPSFLRVSIQVCDDRITR